MSTQSTDMMMIHQSALTEEGTVTVTKAMLENEAKQALEHFRRAAGHRLKFKSMFGFDVLSLFSPKMRNLELGKVYRKLAEENTDWQFGFIPQMAAASGFSVGSVNSESFCERMMSAGKLVFQEASPQARLR